PRQITAADGECTHRSVRPRPPGRLRNRSAHERFRGQSDSGVRKWKSIQTDLDGIADRSGPELLVEFEPRLEFVGGNLLVVIRIDRGEGSLEARAGIELGSFQR